MLEDAGFTKNADGILEKDGKPLAIEHWIVAGDEQTRRIQQVIAAMGPKFSSARTPISSVQSVSTVGWKKSPPRACGAPPTITCAPCATASAMCSRTLAMAAGSIIGPTITPGSVPGPTLNCSTLLASF